MGAILAPGKRTVTSALRIMGRSDEADFQNFQRVLNRAVWSSIAASRILLSLLVSAFAPEGVLVMGIDDTIERRRGDQIKAKGIYRDPVRSSHSHFVKASGLRWLSLMLRGEILASAQTQWQSVNVAGWYGESERTVEITSGTCVWYHTGMPAVPIRWVLVRDPQEKFEAQAFLCTNVAAEPQQILEWFVRRWRAEVTFEETRAHLGVET